MSEMDNSTAVALTAALNNLAAQISLATSQMATAVKNGRLSVDVTGVLKTQQG